MPKTRAITRLLFWEVRSSMIRLTWNIWIRWFAIVCLTATAMFKVGAQQTSVITATQSDPTKVAHFAPPGLAQFALPKVAQYTPPLSEYVSS